MKTVVGERGQVTIPKPLRDRLGIRPGQRLEVTEEPGRVVLTKPIDDDPVAAVYGIMKLGMSTDEFMEEIRVLGG